MTDSELLAQLRSFVGRHGAPHPSRDPVNVPMARQWCDAMDDHNPLYTDEGYAARGPFGGIVAPPTMLDVWNQPGLSPRTRDNPRGEVFDLLDHKGYTSVVGVDTGVEIRRYVRPGELLSSVLTLDDVSDEKQTSLGPGHFVTARSTFRNQDGDHVGDVTLRVLKYRPGTCGPSTAAAEPPADPSLRPRPGINRDNQFFWDGARVHELRVQVCDRCGAAFFPPKPRCSECGSFDLGWVVSKGLGTVHAWAVPHHPQLSGFTYPVLVVLVELDEGVRIVSNLVGAERAHLRIGMPVELCWLDSHPALVEGADDSRGPISLPQFRPRRPVRRTDTVAVADLGVGDALPLCPIEITPTLVVSTSLATRDFGAAHHHSESARKLGMKDMLTNIHTSLGLAQRYLTDCLGPEALFRDVQLRLGTPNYAGDTMTMTGSVSSADASSGEVVVAFRGFNSLGDHMTGTAGLVLPGGSSHALFAKGAGR